MQVITVASNKLACGIAHTAQHQNTVLCGLEYGPEEILPPAPGPDMGHNPLATVCSATRQQQTFPEQGICPDRGKRSTARRGTPLARRCAIRRL